MGKFKDAKEHPITSLELPHRKCAVPKILIGRDMIPRHRIELWWQQDLPFVIQGKQMISWKEGQQLLVDKLEQLKGQQQNNKPSHQLNKEIQHIRTYREHIDIIQEELLEELEEVQLPAPETWKQKLATLEGKAVKEKVQQLVMDNRKGIVRSDLTRPDCIGLINQLIPLLTTPIIFNIRELMLRKIQVAFNIQAPSKSMNQEIWKMVVQNGLIQKSVIKTYLCEYSGMVKQRSCKAWWIIKIIDGEHRSHPVWTEQMPEEVMEDEKRFYKPDPIEYEKERIRQLIMEKMEEWNAQGIHKDDLIWAVEEHIVSYVPN
jgi:hypothetical protein